MSCRAFNELKEIARGELNSMGHNAFVSTFFPTYVDVPDVQGGFALGHSTMPLCHANNNPQEALNRKLKYGVMHRTRTGVQQLVQHKISKLCSLAIVSQPSLSLKEVSVRVHAGQCFLY